MSVALLLPEAIQSIRAIQDALNRGDVDGVLERVAPDVELDLQIAELQKSLKAASPDHPYVPLLMTAPGIGWVLGFTIAAEIGDITRFASPTKLQGYTGLCPKVIQSGNSDRRGPLSKHGPKYLRRALLEATIHALRHPVYADRYQRTKRRAGRQRGAKVAQVEIARRVTVAIWHMLTANEPFNAAAPGGAAFRLAARPIVRNLRRSVTTASPSEPLMS